MTPPPQRCASRNLGSKPCPPKSASTSVKLPRTEKQICPWMKSNAQSTRPPIRMASTLEPMTPLAPPRNMRVMSTALPWARLAIGVAADTPSSGNWVIWRLKDTMRKQRPARAGLMKFRPMPPKQHLATNMAKNEPRTGIYQGTSGESVSASIRPVTAAE